MLLCVLAACADDSTEKNPVQYTEAALDELAPYAVGVHQTKLTYVAPGEAEPRELPLIVWYPGEAQEDAREAVLKLLNIFPIDDSRALSTLAPADLDARPLAIYSHGSGGEASLAYPFAEQFAARGWIVASVGHTGNTTADMAGSSARSLVEMSVLRPMDIRALLDSAEEGFGIEGFEGWVKTDKTFLFGHSFGGFTSLLAGGASYSKVRADERACGDETSEACVFMRQPEVLEQIDAGFDEPRIVAIGLQAPATMGVLDVQNVNVPTLMLTGDRDQTTTHEGASVPIWDGLNHPQDLWVRFEDAGHMSFISICEIVPVSAISAFQPGAKEDGCGEDFVPPGEVVRINTSYLVSFAEAHVLGVDAWAPYVRGEQHFEIEGDAEIQQLVHTP